MKKLSVLLATLVASVALATTAFAGQGGGDDGDDDDKIEVETEVTINFTSGTGPYYQQAGFFGDVIAKKGCRRDRTVVVKRVGGSPRRVGDTQSANDGTWAVPPDVPFTAGSFKAVAKKEKREKANGDIKVCERGVSNTIP